MGDTVVLDAKIAKKLTKELIVILKSVVNRCPTTEHYDLTQMIRSYTVGEPHSTSKVNPDPPRDCAEYFQCFITQFLIYRYSGMRGKCAFDTA